jgi:hypothetical protein
MWRWFLPSKVCIFPFLQIDVVAAPGNLMSVTSNGCFPANAVLAYSTTLEAIAKRKGRKANPMEIEEANTGLIVVP